MKIYVSLLIGFLLLSSTAFAQFTGPSATGRISTVTEARSAPVDTYVTLTGNIVAHLREDYYTFRDQTGEVRVEIEPEVWRNRNKKSGAIERSGRTPKSGWLLKWIEMHPGPSIFGSSHSKLWINST